jgi:hypothetical protein
VRQYILWRRHAEALQDPRECGGCVEQESTMSWLIRPLQDTDTGKWTITAINVGPPTTAVNERGIITAMESGELMACDTHVHDTEAQVERCDECGEWTRQFGVTS